MYNRISDLMTVLADDITVASMSLQEAKKIVDELTPEQMKEIGKILKTASEMKTSGTVIALSIPSGMRKAIIALSVLLAGYVPTIFGGTGSGDKEFDEIINPVLKADIETLTLKGREISDTDIKNFKERAADLEGYFKEIGKRIKVKESGDTFDMPKKIKIGDKNIAAVNEREYNILQAMSQLSDALGKEKSKGLLTPTQYKEKIDDLVEKFETERRVKKV